MTQPVLKLNNVCVDYDMEEGTVRAVRGATYELLENETLALVGESGCGKSQSSYAAIGLVQPPGRISGEILFWPTKDAQPVNLLGFSRNSREIRKIRGGRIAMIFQEPMSSLSPVHRIGAQLDEVLKLHTDLTSSQRRERGIELLSQVGIPDAHRRYEQYSFEFSGGMRQRIMIAIALACNPRVLFADEPTTGLDVTIQAQILELIRALQKKTGMSVILITHDLAVVAERADRVAIMYLGRIVELADVYTLFATPRHPYTVALMRSVIGSPLTAAGKLSTIQGTVPGPLEEVPGCPFHPRCERFMAGICDRVVPEFKPVDDKTQAACHLYGDKIGHASP
jgi:oligopeptide/dipeptide ABC transporter ATP-binding protein